MHFTHTYKLLTCLTFATSMVQALPFTDQDTMVRNAYNFLFNRAEEAFSLPVVDPNDQTVIEFNEKLKTFDQSEIPPRREPHMDSEVNAQFGNIFYEPFDSEFAGYFSDLVDRFVEDGNIGGEDGSGGFGNASFTRLSLDAVPQYVDAKWQKTHARFMSNSKEAEDALHAKEEQLNKPLNTAAAAAAASAEDEQQLEAQTLTPDQAMYIFRTSVFRHAIHVDHGSTYTFDLNSFLKSDAIKKRIEYHDNNINFKFVQRYGWWLKPLYMLFMFPSKFVESVGGVTWLLGGRYLNEIDFIYRATFGQKYYHMFQYVTQIDYVPSSLHGQTILYMTITLQYHSYFPCFFTCFPGPDFKLDTPKSGED